MTSDERRIDAGDITLFDRIFGQSIPGDRRTWLALQRATRSSADRYAYLEIGSYLGGSLQGVVIDPRCEAIYAIDKRTFETADDRPHSYEYPDNTSAEMLKRLGTIEGADLAKVRCHDKDASDIKPAEINPRPVLLFIDGEHTKEAVLRDFAWCRNVAAPNATIYFHDDDVIFRAIIAIVRGLRRSRVPFTPLKLGGRTFVLAFGDSPVARDPGVLAMRKSIDLYFAAMWVRRWGRILTPKWLERPAKWVKRHWFYGDDE